MNDQEILKEQLRTVNQSIFYLILTVLSVLLSLWPVLVQREQLEKMLTGVPQKTAVPDVFPIRLNAAAVAVAHWDFSFACPFGPARMRPIQKILRHRNRRG